MIIEDLLLLSLSFVSNRWFSDFGLDGGPAAKAIGPKFDVFTKHVHSHVAVQVPDIEVKRLAAAAIALKGIGGIFFIFGSNLGAFLLVGI
ncbi:hypothetical protein CFP56_040631 [Quercus suber]|uniref:Uncharacterized protein n=1 Tax=Quercus suber TaxID=58331 RepID=A0AAW0IXL7_QUESU